MASNHSNHVDHPEIPLKTYLNIFFALVVMTVVTVAAARFDFGALNTVIALAIASVKAGLVLAYFMHLKYDDKLYLVGFFTAIFFVILLYLFSVLDIFTRIAQDNIL
jgi:cytochrome c oxidase subunit 4